MISSKAASWVDSAFALGGNEHIAQYVASESTHLTYDASRFPAFSSFLRFDESSVPFPLLSRRIFIAVRRGPRPTLTATAEI